jgi:AcrR family transcriptional regulator
MKGKTEAKPRGRPPKDSADSLTREQIIGAALELIDEKGLDAFSLRDAARKLNVYPTALYWHFAGGRNAVLAEVATIAFHDVAPPFPPEEDWRGWLRGLLQRYRQSLQRHPNIAPLLGAQLVSNTGIDPMLVEQILAALKTAGFSTPHIVDAYNAVVAAMIGYVTLELAPMPVDDPADWASEMENRMRGLPADQYPLLLGHMELMLNKAFIVRWQSGRVNPLTGGFDLYVEMVIAGLEGILSRQQAGVAS